MKKSILRQATKIAIDKIDSHPEYDHYIHYTFVVQGNKIVEWATNNRGVPPIHFGYHGRLQNENYLPKIHSEIAAWWKAKGLLDHKKPFEVVNIRLNKGKELRISKPCECCHNIMKALGCNKFYYSSNVGFLVTR